MDPLTQGLLGAAAAQALCGRALPRAAWPIGMLAGMAADLDVLIRPAGDPLSGFSYHRHFTHALAFIPIGGLLTAIPFLPWKRWQGNRGAILAAAVAAYATHGLLDACTSFGTLLYWPFSSARVAWDFISIVDPVFTAILLIGLVWSLIRRRPHIAAITLCAAVLYMGVGAWQHSRALAVQHALAEARGHQINRGRALPTLANLTVWRSIYEANGMLYADTLRLPWFGPPQVREGSAKPQVTKELLAERGYRSPAVVRAFERLSWFADGYTAFDTRDAQMIGDMRYAGGEDGFASLWGLRLPPPESDKPPHFERLSGGRRGHAGTANRLIAAQPEGFESLASVLERIRRQ